MPPLHIQPWIWIPHTMQTYWITFPIKNYFFRLSQKVTMKQVQPFRTDPSNGKSVLRSFVNWYLKKVRWSMVNWSSVTSTVAEDFQHKKQFSTIDKEWDYNWPSWCSMLWLPRNCEEPWSSKRFPKNEVTTIDFILAVRRPNQPLSSCFYDFFVFQKAGDQPFSAARLMWNITLDVFLFQEQCFKMWSKGIESNLFVPSSYALIKNTQ